MQAKYNELLKVNGIKADLDIMEIVSTLENNWDYRRKGMYLTKEEVSWEDCQK